MEIVLNFIVVRCNFFCFPYVLEVIINIFIAIEIEIALFHFFPKKISKISSKNTKNSGKFVYFEYFFIIVFSMFEGWSYTHYSEQHDFDDSLKD